jgi:hypothetical protein
VKLFKSSWKGGRERGQHAKREMEKKTKREGEAERRREEEGGGKEKISTGVKPRGFD